MIGFLLAWMLPWIAYLLNVARRWWGYPSGILFRATTAPWAMSATLGILSLGTLVVFATWGGDVSRYEGFLAGTGRDFAAIGGMLWLADEAVVKIGFLVRR